MDRLSAIICSLFVCVTVQATPRAPDQLQVGGDEHWVHGFRVSKEMAEVYRRYHWNRELERQDLAWSSANGSRYKPVLSIVDSKLYLVRATVLVYNEEKGYHQEEIPLATLFGIAPGKHGIPAEWFTGGLREYYGEEIGYSELTDRVKLYRFEKGLFRGIEDIAVPEAQELRKKLGLPKQGSAGVGNASRTWPDPAGAQRGNLPVFGTALEARDHVLKEANIWAFRGSVAGSEYCLVKMPSGRETDNWEIDSVFSCAFEPFGKEAIPVLIELVDHDFEYARLGAEHALMQITGRYDSRDLSRKEKAAEWQAWWQENKDNPRLDTPPDRVYEARDWATRQDGTSSKRDEGNQ